MKQTKPELNYCV